MRRLVALSCAVPLALLGGVAEAQQAVTSQGPERVAVTLYRAPNRASDEAMDRDWLAGYALVTERRTIIVPQGRATIRFEGVAAGILAESAIVTGMPQGVREKNLDAELLSPRNLYARSLGRPVTIRRELKGRTVEERAIIRSGPDGAAILQTREGFQAVRCGKPDESLVYDGVPPGLSAKPTLSIETESPQPTQATVTLSYLAWGFDWQADYVATMRPDGRSADLFAWVTLASSDTTSFADAETMVVAGKVSREDSAPYSQDRDEVDEANRLEFHCFAAPPAPPPPPPPPIAMMSFAPAPAPEPAGAEGIVVTAARMVRQEDLGDLKLYRVPEPTTVAAMAMKQVALLDRSGIPVEIVYRATVLDDDASAPMIVLRAQNRKADGLGLPLPAGKVALFEPLGQRRLLVGEGAIADKAEGEEVEIEVAEATQVTAKVELDDDGDTVDDQVLTVTNANPHPIVFEAELSVSEDRKRTRASAKFLRKNGHDVWRVDVPANGTARLKFRLKDVES